MPRPAVIVLAWLLLAAQVSYAAGRFELHNSVPARATAERWMRAADPDEALEMSVTLRLRQPDDLAALIAAQQDPASPDYHRWLTPDEFAARFAPSADDYTRVVDWLQRQGFVVRPKVSATRIDFGGTVVRVEGSFGVRMNHYAHRGRTPLANEDPPLLPEELAGAVAFVRLNTFPLAEPLVRVTGSGGLSTAMAPGDMYLAYDMQTLLDAGTNGAGQTIAVVARSDFDNSDVTSFQQRFDVAVRIPVKVFPAANPGVGAPNGICRDVGSPRERRLCMQGEQDEVLLDVQWASAMGPGATVLVDISGADIDASLLDIVTHHPEARIITISFGSCERLDAADLTLFGPMYAQATVQGQTVFVSSGDDGTDECQDGRGRSVNVLASDANVTSVGGTALDPGFDANGDATRYVSETVWNDSSGASGGGASTLVSKPAYQSALGVPSDGFRDQPDVSLLASPMSAGYVMVVDGAVSVAGGTSAAAPSWAGIVALLNDANGRAGSGSMNALLYKLGREQYAGSGLAVFHDVTHGNNGFDRVAGYVAGTGYDLASGLGSPDVAVLAQAFELALPTVTHTPAPTATSTPTPTIPPATPTPSAIGAPCAGDCNGDGAVTVDELVLGVGIALGNQLLSACPNLDVNRDGQVTVAELLQAVDAAVRGCATNLL